MYWVPSEIHNRSKLRKCLGFLIFLASEINLELLRTIVKITPQNHISSIPSSIIIKYRLAWGNLRRIRLRILSSRKDVVEQLALELV